MDTFEGLHFATMAIRAGQQPDAATGALNTPIYETTTFAYDSLASYEERSKAALSWKPNAYFYSRTANPTTVALQRKIAALEGAEDATATACGMGAVNMTLMALLNPGDHCIASDDLFVVTRLSMEQMYPEKGISVDTVDMTNLAEIEEKIRPNTKVIYLEALSNPHLKLMNLPQIADLAHRNNILLVVDNTFLSPYLLRPLEHGADLVLHSATKYLSGHGDALCGLVSGKKSIIDQIREYSDRLGSHISPFDSWLVLRGMHTLHLRLKQQSENALEIARYLESNPQVAYVRYPGLESHPQHLLAKDLLKNGFGGMIFFYLKGGYQAMEKFVDALQVFPIATSLGDVTSLLDPYPVHPNDGFLRISVGCEDTKDLISDLERGFQAVKTLAE